MYWISVVQESYIRMLVRYFRFGLQLLDSAIVSSAQFLNRVSFSYRFVRKCLQEEKLR